MATLIQNRGLQYPLTAVFEFDIAANDQMIQATGGAAQLFKSAAGVYEIVALPVNSIILSGSLTVDVASNDSGAPTVAVGDSGAPARYLAATSIKTAGVTPLVPTGLINSSGLNVRITVAAGNGDATAGRVRLVVNFITKNRQNETQIT